MYVRIEEKEVMSNHRDSSVARFLLEQGFRDIAMDDFHRCGPRVFVDLDNRVFTYCPHFGCSPCGVGGPLFENAPFTLAEFRKLYAVVESALRRQSACPDWSRRISRRGRTHTVPIASA